MSQVVVSFIDVEKRFASIRALCGTSFDVHEGEIFGLIGPNGCGKTTTVRLMLGFYKPTSGKVSVCERDPQSHYHEIGQKIGVMLELTGVNDSLTALEYLEYYGVIFDMRRSDVEKMSWELLELVGLTERAHSLLKTFSKGMRQRVSLARCLLNSPRLIVMDEPFDGLDVDSRRKILDVLAKESRENGVTVFLTSHNLAEVDEISDRVAIMKSGQVLAIGNTAELKAALPNRKTVRVVLAKDFTEGEIAALIPDYTYQQSGRTLQFNIESSNGDKNAILSRLIALGLPIASVQDESATLEDLYFEVTKSTGV